MKILKNLIFFKNWNLFYVNKLNEIKSWKIVKVNYDCDREYLSKKRKKILN